jgi:hypothetical protein
LAGSVAVDSLDVGSRVSRVISGAVGLGAPLAVTAVANAFTGTPAALGLVHAMRRVYNRVHVVDNVRTGDVFYCPSVTEGWDYVPIEIAMHGRAWSRSMTSHTVTSFEWSAG